MTIEQTVGREREIEVEKGWPVSAVRTLEDCARAFAVLSAAIAEIKYQIEQNKLGNTATNDPSWLPRARRALRYKQAALKLVLTKREEIIRGLSK